MIEFSPVIEEEDPLLLDELEADTEIQCRSNEVVPFISQKKISPLVIEGTFMHFGIPLEAHAGIFLGSFELILSMFAPSTIVLVQMGHCELAAAFGQHP